MSKPREIAIVGDPESADTRALLRVVRDVYRHFQVVALGALDGGKAADSVGGMAVFPLLQHRGQLDGQATAYGCRDFACQAPGTKPEELRAQLE